MTVRELVTKAAQKIGVVASGEALPANEASDLFDALLDMIEGWSVDGLTIPIQTQEDFSLVASTASYTIGSGAVFDTARPVNINDAAVLIGSVEYPLDIITGKQWAEISNKSITSTIPTKLFYDKTSPLGTIHLYPIPSAASTIRLYSEKTFTAFASLDTDVQMLPGTTRALIHNLAVEAAPEYGKEASGTIQRIANDSLANLKKQAIEPSYVVSDFTSGSANDPYRIYTGN